MRLKDTVDYINVKSKTNHASTFLHVSRRAHCYIAGKASSELLDTLPRQKVKLRKPTPFLKVPVPYKKN